MPSIHRSENDLLDSIRLGDRAAFEQLFEQYWELLYQLAAQKTGDDSEAEDIVQELFVELWRRETPVVLTTSLRTYLVSCLYYKVLYHFRQKGFRERHYAAFARFSAEHTAIVDMDSTEFETAYAQLREVVDGVVALMPKQMRTVFLLKHYQGQPVNRIAEQLEISPETVKSHLKTAMSRLRKASAHSPKAVLLLPAFLGMLESSY
ncbi:RNA polymerase sigma-70 factor, ECF subfamily [Chitinophaga ginsengisegetis]|uniref:RNA polymerase sigma-70 factor, ECF subfamily n=1 Tax=Chitinophaga ginsengisegetis TaxID=393003 RepID=A0A1T5NZ24_9BACT|nr:sigma-70 family RNA polymerase sigma factor [Chitinophaga ginsengisegetis]SKD05368.1 RNA polymerase sigma-70 factor, ECF subfamily [Chitinophaga ginsengisegetis]